MISYDPRQWFTYIFRFHKADTVRQLAPLLFGVAVYSGVIAYLELEYWKLSGNNNLRNIPILHNLLGFAISILLVFRTNTAYDRWWEGRKLWGQLVNNSRNFAIKLNSFLPESAHVHRNFFRKAITAYANSLHNHLHKEAVRLELFEGDESKELMNEIDHSRHVPNQVADMIYKRITQLYNEKIISGDQLIVLNAEFQSFTEICGACERIKNTPIPFSYSVFIKKFIFIYIMTMPFGYVFSLGYYMIPVVVFVLYVLASLELIAEEIEDPFGGDPNDVPTDKISENIRRTVAEILS